MVLPGKVTAQGSAVAEQPTRPQGAPLTVILSGKKMPGTEDGPGPALQARGIEPALRRGPPTCGKRGSSTWRRWRARRATAEGARHNRRPGVGQWPRRLPRLVLVVVPVSITAFLLDDFASPACVRATGPALGVPEARP